MEVVYIAEVQKTFSMVLGVVLILVGLLGFFNNPILGLFGVNALQDIVHILGGALLIWQAGKTANMYLGIAGILLAVLWFIPGTGGDTGLLYSIFGINAAISYLHLVIGVVSLGVCYGVKE